MIANKECYERGCACYDSRVDGEGIKVVAEHEWVGLTDEEVELYWDWEDFQTGAGRSTIFEMVRDIEAKLKEKNSDHRN